MGYAAEFATKELPFRTLKGGLRAAMQRLHAAAQETTLDDDGENLWAAECAVKEAVAKANYADTRWRLIAAMIRMRAYRFVTQEKFGGDAEYKKFFADMAGEMIQAAPQRAKTVRAKPAFAQNAFFSAAYTAGSLEDRVAATEDVLNSKQFARLPPKDMEKWCVRVCRSLVKQKDGVQYARGVIFAVQDTDAFGAVLAQNQKQGTDILLGMIATLPDDHIQEVVGQFSGSNKATRQAIVTAIYDRQGRPKHRRPQMK